jgi:hypothetical protein
LGFLAGDAVRCGNAGLGTEARKSAGEAEHLPAGERFPSHEHARRGVALALDAEPATSVRVDALP